MINIRQFEIALKLTWVRTYINGTPDWSEFACKYRIGRLLQTDVNYHNGLLNNVSNQFWRSVITGYTNFYLSVKNEILQKIEVTPLWGNPDIKVKFNTPMFRANIRYLQDLYRGNTRVSLKDLNIIAQTELPFTFYLSIWKNIPRQMKPYMETRIIDCNLIYPVNIHWLRKDKKGTKNIRLIMTKNSYRTNYRTGKMV